MNVGFIGTGVMGKPMAQNILEGGYDLTVHTRTKEQAQELLEAPSSKNPSRGD